MQPVRLTIPGTYWDSQLYRGRLYLAREDGGIAVYSWDDLLEPVMQRSQDELAVRCALANGDYLYGERWADVFRDQEVHALLVHKFNRLASSSFSIEPSALLRAQIGVRESLSPSLADDTLFYNNRMFALTNEGVFTARVHASSVVGRSHGGIGKSVRLWDGRGTSLALRPGGDLAIAAASDGLFEVSLQEIDFRRPDRAEPHRLTEEHVGFSSYAFASIFASSFVSEGRLLGYGWRSAPRSGRRERHRTRDFSESEVFGECRGLTWGSQEKLYQWDQAGLRAVKYTQSAVASPEWNEESGVSPFESLGSIKPEAPPEVGRVFYAAVTLFGVVIEGERGLLVIMSDESWYPIAGPIVRWRVFPRSHRYENQLHVVFEDRIEILSFNHDYFVDQGTKRAGLTWTEPWVARRNGPTTINRA